MYRKILVALSGSAHDGTLVSAAATLAARSGASAVALHVGGPEDQAGGAHVAREARDRLRAAGVPAQLRAATADRRHVAGEIARAADAEGADLIVMGSRGLGELHAILAGSVSRGVVTRTDRPVLLVRRQGGRVPAEVRVALVAVAGAEDAEAIIGVLDGLSTVKQVVVFHVCPIAGAYGEAPVYVEPAEEGEGVVRRAVARLRQAGYRVTGRVAWDVTVSGGAARAIANEARGCGADVVIAGSSRPSGVEGLLLGSTARALVRECDRPVLIAGRVPVPGRLA